MSTAPTEPWSKKHKAVKRAHPVLHSLSNSFAQPCSAGELLALARARGDHALADAYLDHPLKYTPNGGSRDLRAEIAKLYASDCIGPENVLVFCGAQVALQTAANALAAGGHTIVFTPGYQSTVECPAMAGADVTRIRLSAADDWQVPIDKVRAPIRPGETNYMVLNEPYNPAGTVMSRDTQRALVALARRHSIRILSDEVYRLLEHDPERDRLPAMADVYEKGISCVTLSKPWGACGVTIGWLAFQDASGVKQRLVDAQYFGTACPSRASELLAIMVLRASEPLLRRNLRVIRHNLQLLCEFMDRYADLFAWVRPRAGAVCFVKFLGPLTSAQLGLELARAGISVKPAYCFSDAVEDDIDYFRVGFGEEGKVPAALRALTAFVEQRKGAWRDAMQRSGRASL